MGAYNLAKEDGSAQPELQDQEILDAVQEVEEEIEGGPAEKSVTDRFTMSEKIIILGCDCTLLDLSQQTQRSAHKLLCSLQADIGSASTTLHP